MTKAKTTKASTETDKQDPEATTEPNEVKPEEGTEEGEDTVLPTQQATTEPVNTIIERPAAIEPGKFVCERSGITQVNR